MIESTFKDKAFEAFVMKVYEEDSREIFPVEYEGQKYWVKKARATSSNFFHKLMYKLLKLDILLPVDSKSSEEALVFETNKLEKFQQLEISVPRVIGRNSSFFVIENVGKDIHSFIKKRDISKESMHHFINKMTALLSSVHNKGQYHGGPQSRNFTYLDEQVFMIDFEESFNKSVSLRQLQIRDLLLFLMSLSKTRASFKVDYLYVLNEYEKLTGNIAYRNELRKVAEKTTYLIKIMDNGLISKFVPEEILSFTELFKFLMKMEIKSDQ